MRVYIKTSCPQQMKRHLSGTDTIEFHKTLNGKRDQELRTGSRPVLLAFRSFPAAGDQAVLNKSNKKSKTNRKRTNNNRMTRNRSTALGRSVLNNWGRGFKPVSRARNSRHRFCCCSLSYSVRVKVNLFDLFNKWKCQF